MSHVMLTNSSYLYQGYKCNTYYEKSNRQTFDARTWMPCTLGSSLYLKFSRKCHEKGTMVGNKSYYLSTYLSMWDGILKIKSTQQYIVFFLLEFE